MVCRCPTRCWWSATPQCFGAGRTRSRNTITEQPLPDPKVLNAAIPVEEWEIGLDGNPTPPWKLTYVIYMVDLKTGAPVHVRALTHTAPCSASTTWKSNRSDAHAPRRACASNRAPRKAPDEVAVRDEVHARICSHRMAYARVAVVPSWHRNRRLRSSLDRLRLRLQPRRLQRLRLRLRQLNSGTSSDSDCLHSASVDGPRQHEAGQAGHGRGTRRRRNPPWK